MPEKELRNEELEEAAGGKQIRQTDGVDIGKAPSEPKKRRSGPKKQSVRRQDL